MHMVGLKKLIIIFFIVSSLISSCSCQEQTVADKKLLLDTMVSIVIYPEGTDKPAGLLDKAYSQLADLESTVNVYNRDSELSKINAAENSEFELSPNLRDMIVLGLDWYGASKGTFDIGLGATINAWSIGSGNIIPKQDQLVRTRVDDLKNNVRVEGNRLIFSGAKPKLDLNGLAKGYGADKAVRVLKDGGIKHGLIDMGSSAVAFGGKPDGNSWQIGIQHPRDDKGLLGTISINDGFIATSGDYQQYFIKDGIRYHHIIDPATSCPANKSIAVTVVSQDSAVIADILSTTAFILGPKTGLELLERLPETEGLLIDARGNISMTSGFGQFYRPKVKKIKDPSP